MKVSAMLKQYIEAEVKSKAKDMLAKAYAPYEKAKGEVEATLQAVVDYAGAEKKKLDEKIAAFAKKRGLTRKEGRSMVNPDKWDFKETEGGIDGVESVAKMKKFADAADAKVEKAVRDIILKLELGAAGRKDVADMLANISFD